MLCSASNSLVRIVEEKISQKQVTLSRSALSISTEGSSDTESKTPAHNPYAYAIYDSNEDDIRESDSESNDFFITAENLQTICEESETETPAGRKSLVVKKDLTPEQVRASFQEIKKLNT